MIRRAALGALLLLMLKAAPANASAVLAPSVPPDRGSPYVLTTDALYRATFVSASPPSAAPSGASAPTPTASPGAPLSGLRSRAGIVVLAVILGALFLVRARLSRRSGR